MIILGLVANVSSEIIFFVNCYINLYLEYIWYDTIDNTNKKKSQTTYLKLFFLQMINCTLVSETITLR